jgi:hypothetical protein
MRSAYFLSTFAGSRDLRQKAEYIGSMKMHEVFDCRFAGHVTGSSQAQDKTSIPLKWEVCVTLWTY